MRNISEWEWKRCKTKERIMQLACCLEIDKLTNNKYKIFMEFFTWAASSVCLFMGFFFFVFFSSFQNMIVHFCLSISIVLLLLSLFKYICGQTHLPCHLYIQLLDLDDTLPWKWSDHFLFHTLSKCPSCHASSFFLRFWFCIPSQIE